MQSPRRAVRKAQGREFPADGAQGTEWEYSEFWLYDLGQAVAHMTLQGQALGLHARQFRAFDRAGLEAEFDVPPHWQVTTMTAFGRPHPDADSAAPGPGLRDRRAAEQLVWPAARAAAR